MSKIIINTYFLSTSCTIWTSSLLQMDQNASFFIMKSKLREKEVRHVVLRFSSTKLVNGGGLDKKKVIKSLYLTDGTKEAFPGLGLFFLRTTTKPITTANVASETFFGILESNGGGLLEAVESLLSWVFLPALKEQTNWGTLSSDANGHVIKEAFLGKLASFISVLANARASIANAAKLSPCKDPALESVTSPSDIMAAAVNPELVEAAEKCVQKWCKEIELTLTQSEQMRKESDDVGPRAELEHWKKRMAKFDSLISSIKHPHCRAIVNILVAAKSKVLQVRHI